MISESMRPLDSSYEPTAQHSEEDAHVTPVRKLDESAGFGAETVDHVFPSQCAMPSAEYSPFDEPPTAQQSEADGHAMLIRMPTLGEGVMVHDVPSQCSIRGALPASPPAPLEPVAQQSEAEAHVTL